MNILPEIIAALTKEEARNYKLFIKRTNDTDDRKDELLFDLIKKQFNENYNEDGIFKTIYNNDNKNPFYRLKNKLHDDIGLSLTFFHFNASAANIILKDIFLSKIFFEKNAWTISKYYLVKAEKRAIENENYELLDLIYTEFIKLSHELLDTNPEDYIHKRTLNKKKLDDLREIDNVLSVAIYKIRSTQNFSKDVDPINQLLEKIISKLTSNKNQQLTNQLKFKIYQSVSRILLSRHEYQALEGYLLKCFDDFTKQNLFNKSNHDTKLQMLVYICNTLFKTRKYELSLSYAKYLKDALEEHNAFLKNKYVYYYYNCLVINYSEIDREKAIDVLIHMLTVEAIFTHPMYISYVYLNLATLYFDTENYKLSLKSLVKLTKHEAYTNLDEAFRLKIEIAELIVRYMLQDYEYLDNKQKIILKDYKSLLSSPLHASDTDFLKLLRQLSKVNGDVKHKKTKVSIDEYLRYYQTHNEQQQTEVINYSNWLKKLIGEV